MPPRLAAWLRALAPAPLAVDGRERWRALVGAGLGIALAALCGQALLSGDAGWLVAPMGATAVLAFATPASPLAQPWAVLAGNGVAALVGLACAQLGWPLAAGGALAVALAMGAMLALRCLHPPGGAVALSMVLAHAGPTALLPVLLNSATVVLAAAAYNNATGRRYPHPQRSSTPRPASRFSTADLDAALAHYNQVLDVSRDDLEALLQEAEYHAFRRNLGDLVCADVMSSPPVTVQFGTALAEAWRTMRSHRIKALPVADRAGHLVGIVTLQDFMRLADLDAAPEGLGTRLRDWLRRTGLSHTERPEVVGQIMTRSVRVASAARPLVELVPLFSEGGHHHVPVIDAQRRVVGVITQTDLVRALYRAVQP
jgi:CBS domain-containing membrane protein